MVRATSALIDRWLEPPRRRPGSRDAGSGRPARRTAYSRVAATDRVAELRVLVHERRHEAVEQAEHVVADEDLAVAVGSGADADRRNRQRLA